MEGFSWLQQQTPRMDESLVKYLAGLLDADGSLSFQFRLGRNTEDQHHLGLQLALHASSAVDRHSFVASLPRLTGMGSFYTEGDEGKYFRWLVSKRAELEMLIPRLTKHMSVKANHWQWMFETWRDRRGPPISTAERDALAAAAKESRRLRKGPLKPKNHPSWAWLAGFLDGDGHYTRQRQKCGVYKGIQQYSWQMTVGCVAHKEDAHVLEFIQKAHGGNIFEHGQSASCLVWRRAVGARNRSFALDFLPHLARHSHLKRHKIEQMIAHHNSSTHQQRLNIPTPAGEAIV